MAQRGRQSVAAQTTMAPVVVKPRLQPGRRLSKEAQALWDRLLDSQAEGFFTEEHRELLLGWVTHTMAFYRLFAVIDKIPAESLDTKEGMEKYNKVRHALTMESKTMLDYLRQMRLTHYTQYNADAAFLQRKRHLNSVSPEAADKLRALAAERSAKAQAKKHPAEGPVSKTTGKSNPWDH